jgi:E3 ubiquitin-protein ligase HERC2
MKETGQVYAWGSGSNGKLGFGTEYDVKIPREVEFLKGQEIVQLSAGGYHSAAVNGNNSISLNCFPLLKLVQEKENS